MQLASITTWQLIAAGITSFEIRLSFVGAIAAFHIFSKSFLKTWRNDLIDWFVTTIERKHALADLVDFTIVLLLMFWVLSIITFVTTFSRFRLERLGHLALIEHGLITRRWRAVLLPRVQAITFVETPVQEWRNDRLAAHGAGGFASELARPQDAAAVAPARSGVRHAGKALWRGVLREYRRSSATSIACRKRPNGCTRCSGSTAPWAWPAVVAF